MIGPVSIDPHVLAALIRVYGLTHEEAAAAMGVSRSSVQQWCSKDDPRTPHDTYLHKLHEHVRQRGKKPHKLAIVLAYMALTDN